MKGTGATKLNARGLECRFFFVPSRDDLLDAVLGEDSTKEVEVSMRQCVSMHTILCFTPGILPVGSGLDTVTSEGTGGL